MGDIVIRLALALSLMATPVSAQCVPEPVATETLAEKYHEHPIGQGIATTNTLMRLYVSEDGTWTLVVVTTEGHACLLAAGEGWQTFPWGQES